MHSVRPLVIRATTKTKTPVVAGKHNDVAVLRCLDASRLQPRYEYEGCTLLAFVCVSKVLYSVFDGCGPRKRFFYGVLQQEMDFYLTTLAAAATDSTSAI